MWLKDKLLNRKIEGESSIDELEKIQPEILELNKQIAITDGGLIRLKNDVDVTGDITAHGDISSTGEISAKKVVEDGDTELIDLSSYVSSETAKSNTLYAKMLVKHGVLYIICSGNFVAQDLSTATNRLLLDNFIDAIPASLQSKIKREDGSSINETPTSAGSRICSCVGGRFVGSTQANQLYLLNSNQAGQITLQIRPLPSTAEDSTVYVDARFVLTL